MRDLVASVPWYRGHWRRQSNHTTSRGLRQAAYLFLIVGFVGLVSDFLPVGVGYGHPVSIALDSFNVFAGVIIWMLAGKWWAAPTLSLVLPLVAFAIFALNISAGVFPEAAYGIYFVLIFVWVGAWHGRGRVLAFTPFALAAYLLPLITGAPHSANAIGSVLVVVPGALIAGEVVAYNATAARSAGESRDRLLGELARTTVTDALTGVGNRRLGDLLLESLSAGDAIALLDLDHFKEVNDEYGHPEGDRVLRQLGEYVQKSLREKDAVARMGGEEFLVVLRGADREAELVVEHLLTGWKALAPIVTISAGVALHGRHADWHQTYAAADAALYEAKRLGRDRVMMLGAERALPAAA